MFAGRASSFAFSNIIPAVGKFTSDICKDVGLAIREQVSDLRYVRMSSVALRIFGEMGIVWTASVLIKAAISCITGTFTAPFLVFAATVLGAAACEALMVGKNLSYLALARDYVKPEGNETLEETYRRGIVRQDFSYASQAPANRVIQQFVFRDTLVLQYAYDRQLV